MKKDKRMKVNFHHSRGIGIERNASDQQVDQAAIRKKHCRFLFMVIFLRKMTMIIGDQFYSHAIFLLFQLLGSEELILPYADAYDNRYVL